MTYYPTLAQDLDHAREILDRGRGGLALLPALPAGLQRDEAATDALRNLVGGTIYGSDIYAAYKILESFVDIIEKYTLCKAELMGALDTARVAGSRVLVQVRGEWIDAEHVRILLNRDDSPCKAVVDAVRGTGTISGTLGVRAAGVDPVTG